jgi:hypothetical protein
LRKAPIAAAVVESSPVVIAAVIDIALREGGLFVAADAGADLDEGLVGNRERGEVDHPAAELTGEIGGIGLLDQARGDHVGRKDVERDHAAERFGRGERQAVEQRKRVAIAEAADVNEAVADRREAGDAVQRTGDVAFAGAGDRLGAEHVDDLGGSALDVAAALPGYDNFAAGDRDVGFVNLLLALGGGRVGNRLHVLGSLGALVWGAFRAGPGRGACILGQGETRIGQGGGDEQQPCQSRASGHRGTPSKKIVGMGRAHGIPPKFERPGRRNRRAGPAPPVTNRPVARGSC